MGRAVILDDMTDEVRASAQAVATKVDRPHKQSNQDVLDELQGQPALRGLIAAFAERLVRDIAAGRHPMYVTSEDDVSPAETAQILGVSRQFVDRLLISGRIPFNRKPGSTHRTILVSDVEAFAAERARRRTNTDKAIAALLDGGLEY